MNNFWKKLNRPFYVLAPMADVTDAPFRRIIAKYGKPDVTWTEFVSADGLVLAPEAGKKKLLKDLEYDESERPIVAQLFSSRPENMEKAARLCKELGFDGLDINMGCPDKSIEKQGCGAAMIKNPENAKEVILAAMRGFEGPVSVKTRLGYNKDELETWLPELLSTNPAAITIHARTRKEMSKVPARWERIKRAVEIRDELKSETLILGNGDAIDLADAKSKAEFSGADGVMIGRGIFGNPWCFKNKENFRSRPHPLDDSDPLHQMERVASAPGEVVSLSETLRVLVEHTKLFEELLGGVKNFMLMKKHFKSYLIRFPETKHLKDKLMETTSASEVETLVANFQKEA